MCLRAGRVEKSGRSRGKLRTRCVVLITAEFWRKRRTWRRTVTQTGLSYGRCNGLYSSESENGGVRVTHSELTLFFVANPFVSSLTLRPRNIRSKRHHFVCPLSTSRIRAHPTTLLRTTPAMSSRISPRSNNPTLARLHSERSPPHTTPQSLKKRPKPPPPNPFNCIVCHAYAGHGSQPSMDGISCKVCL